MKSLVTAGLVLLVTAQAGAAQDKRALYHVTGDVYLFQNNFHNSLVVPTGEGTVRIDPINADAGAWLNENLGEVTDEPVTHLIYSHSHLDHASGGMAHRAAETIAHENAPDAIDGVVPSTRVGDTHTLKVGSKTFEIMNLGAGHDNHMLLTVVRPENVAFIVDVAATKRLPYQNLPRSDVDGWIQQLETAMTADFDILAGGHGAVGTKQDLADNLSYMTTLRESVRSGLEAGLTVEELQAGLMLEDYADWVQYDNWRTLNIEGMADFLKASGQVN